MTNEQPELDSNAPELSENEPELQLEELSSDSLDAANSDGGDTIESLREKLDQAEKQALLSLADMENFRRRKSRESQEQLKYAALPMINSLLEVIDNLQRALDSSADDEKTSSSLREGVEIVASQLVAILESHGCVRIESVGTIFDPNQHEAIQMQAADEPQNTIVMEVQSGYRLYDRVVRPAKVIISTGPA